MEPTEYHRPIEPTKPATPPDSFWWESGIIPPPPPPPQARQSMRWVLIPILVLLASMLIFSGIVYYSHYQQRKAPLLAQQTPSVFVPTPTLSPLASPTPTVNPDYTAADIMADFNAAGIHPKYVQYDKTIWSWSANTYFISIHATSSVTWTDDSSCSGYCSPANLGLWVYGSNNEAAQAYNDVMNDENQDGSIPMIGMPLETLHGRCLLLSTMTAISVYQQVVEQNCI